MFEQRLRPVLNRIDALSLRERAITLVTALAVVYLVWDLTIFQSLDRKRTILDRAIENTQESVKKLNDQVTLLAQKVVVDPNEAERRLVESLREELSGLNRSLVEATDHLVPPEEMARVLEAVLTQKTKLELLHLEGLGAEPLVAAGEATGDAEPSTTSSDRPLATAPLPVEPGAEFLDGLFRHGLRIEFRGSYMETLKYLAALERLDWSFLWESVHYRVEDYPRARVSIVVHSLSFDDAWIGV